LYSSVVGFFDTVNILFASAIKFVIISARFILFHHYDKIGTETFKNNSFLVLFAIVWNLKQSNQTCPKFI
jgi:hypothetical protein